MASSISAPGVGAGFDGNAIITQLLAIQSRPLEALRNQQKQIEAQISAYGALKSAASSFQSAMADLASVEKFKQLSATSSNEDAFTVSATSSAVKGAYSVIVNSLATAHKRASSNYANADTDVGGTGSLDISTAAGSFSVSVLTGETLNDIRNKINQDANNPGITASIINEAGGSRLILTADETGADSAISVVTNDDDLNNADNTGLSRLFYVGNGTDDEFAREITGAADASLKVDGFDVTSASNSVTGVIEGVTIDLVASGSGQINVSEDSESIGEKVQAFVDAYNAMRDEISTMYGEGGSLNRDSTLRYMDQNILNIINSPVSTGGTYDYLSQIGVTRDKEGVLSLNTSDLNDALGTDLDSVISIFADSTNGIAVRMEDYAKGLVDFDGLITTREEGLNNRIQTLEDAKSRMELRLDAVEARLIRQFAALDSTVGAMNSTSSFLMNQMSTLNSFGS